MTPDSTTQATLERVRELATELESFGEGRCDYYCEGCCFTCWSKRTKPKVSAIASLVEAQAKRIEELEHREKRMAADLQERMRHGHLTSCSSIAGHECNCGYFNTKYTLVSYGYSPLSK